MVQLQTLQPVADFARTWGPFLLLTVAALAATWLVHRGMKRFGKWDPPGDRLDYTFVVLRGAHPLVVVAAFLLVFWGGVRYLGTGVPQEVVESTARFQLAVFIFIAALVVIRVVNGLLRQRAKIQPQWAGAATIGIRLLDIVIYVVALLVILGTYDVEITPLLTSLGIAGLAVALALQDTLANFFAGIWIQTGKYLRPGHYVKVEDANLEGYVVEVGWRTAKIRTLPGNMIVIPNSKLAQSVVTDFYLPEPMMSLLVPVNVGYESDPEQVEKILIEETLAAAEYTPGLRKDPAPFTRFIPGFGATSLDFTLICKVDEYVDQYLAQNNIRKRILARFREEGIRIPFPIRDVYMVPGDRPDVASRPVGDGGPPPAPDAPTRR